MSEEERGHSKLNNSAIGSWAGYIYQGLCAIYVVLNMIREDKNDEYKDYSFYLDSFEDFSVHDGNGKAVSLHQCKDKKNSGSYKDALDQMRSQKKEFIRQGVCDENAQMYFHCNTKPANLGDDIVMYQYHDKTETCQSAELMDKIKDLVSITIQEKGIVKSADRLCNALFRLVEEQVLIIHEQSMTSKLKLFELARKSECAIKFSKLCDILTSDVTADYNEEEFVSLIKFHLLLSLNINIEERDAFDEWDGLNREYIQYLGEQIAKMDAKTFIDFLKRTQPANNMSKKDRMLINTANEGKAEKLIQTVGSSIIKLTESCDWNEKGRKETPSIFDNSSPTRICNAICENMAQLDCLYEYDWFVTNQSQTTDGLQRDIITRMHTDQGLVQSILEPKIKGLLSIDDFNNGNFN